MAIEEARVDESRDSLAVCLDTILQKEGITRNIQILLDEGKSVKEILSEGIIGARVLELTGVPMDSVLYYLNRDIPVLVMVDNGDAVLLTGFNELNVVVMNPSTGQLGKMGRKDSAKWFEENGILTIDEIKEALAKNGDGFVRAMGGGDPECEKKVKELTGVSSRCIPFGVEPNGDTCVCCGKKAETLVYWGNAY